MRRRWRRLIWRLTPGPIRRWQIRQMNLRCEVIRLRLEVVHQSTLKNLARKELHRARLGLAFKDPMPIGGMASFRGGP